MEDRDMVYVAKFWYDCKRRNNGGYYKIQRLDAKDWESAKLEAKQCHDRYSKGKGRVEVFAIMPLPSGWWSVWKDGTWINAALRSWDDAENYVKYWEV